MHHEMINSNTNILLRTLYGKIMRIVVVIIDFTNGPVILPVDMGDFTTEITSFLYKLSSTFFCIYFTLFISIRLFNKQKLIG